MLDFMTPWFVTEKISIASRVIVIGTIICLLITAVLLRYYRLNKEKYGDKILVKATVTFVLIYALFTTVARALIGIWATERVASPMFVFLILLLLIGLEALARVLSLISRNRWAGYLVIISLCTLWLIFYPLPIAKQRISSYKTNGIPSYNSPSWRGSPLINWLKTHRLDGNVFSNEPHAVHFLTGYAIRMSPRRGSSIKKLKKEMLLKEKNYLIWYCKHWRQYLYNLNELSSMFKLEQVAQFRDGTVFRMQ